MARLPRQGDVKTGAEIGKLLGKKPLVIEPTVPPSSAERIALLTARIRDAARPKEENVYQRDFHRFLVEKVWTKDEPRGGRVEKMPDHPYIREVCDALIMEPLLLIEKSRRVLASWIVSAFDLWIAAGGQDPRWPSLMNATGNRQVIIASRKLMELQGSVWFVQERIKYMYDDLVQNRGVHEWWPEFPRIEFTTTLARASNGSRINAVASGADQVRGAGGTVVHCEEGAFWPEARKSIESALPVLQGGGHLVIVTTPQAGSYCADIVAGRLKDRGGYVPGRV